MTKALNNLGYIRRHVARCVATFAGPYAAANLLMLLGHYDYLPVDSWALKVVSYEWYDGQPIGRKEVEAAFEKWGAYKGMAYWMWDWTYYQTL